MPISISKLLPAQIALLFALFPLAPANANEQLKSKPDFPLAEEAIAISLEDAVQLALQRSYKMARANRNWQISEFRTEIAKANAKPKLNLGINADQGVRGYNYDSSQFLDFRQQTREEFRGNLSLSVSVPIDISNSIERQIRHAKASQNIAAIEAANTSLEVSIDTVTFYMNALRAQHNVDADASFVNLIEDLIDKAKAKNPSIVPFLELELANSRQTLSQSNSAFDIAQDDLRQILRAPPEIKLRLSSNFIGKSVEIDKTELLEKALENRPDVRGADLKVEQSEIARNSVGDNLKPRMSLSGFYTDQLSSTTFYDNSRNRFTNRGIGLNLTVPLYSFDSGTLSRQRQIANFQYSQANADSAEIRERINYEIKRALLAVERAKGRLVNLPDTHKALVALQVSEEEMLAAPSDAASNMLAQISNARKAWRAAETASSDAYIDYNLAVYRLRRIIGESPVQ